MELSDVRQKAAQEYRASVGAKADAALAVVIELAKQMEKKSEFISAAEELITLMRYHYADASDERQSQVIDRERPHAVVHTSGPRLLLVDWDCRKAQVFNACKRAGSLLRSRYTQPTFWRVGRDLFSLACETFTQQVPPSLCLGTCLVLPPSCLRHPFFSRPPREAGAACRIG